MASGGFYPVAYENGMPILVTLPVQSPVASLLHGRDRVLERDSPRFHLASTPIGRGYRPGASVARNRPNRLGLLVCNLPDELDLPHVFPSHLQPEESALGVRLMGRYTEENEHVIKVVLEDLCSIAGYPGKQCELCKKPTEKICRTCSARYCSRDCQVQDWPRHKYYCHPKDDVHSPYVERAPGLRELEYERNGVDTHMVQSSASFNRSDVSAPNGESFPRHRSQNFNEQEADDFRRRESSSKYQRQSFAGKECGESQGKNQSFKHLEREQNNTNESFHQTSYEKGNSIKRTSERHGFQQSSASNFSSHGTPTDKKHTGNDTERFPRKTPERRSYNQSFSNFSSERTSHAPSERKFNANSTDRSPRNRAPGHSSEQSTASHSSLNKTSHPPADTDSFKKKPYGIAKKENSTPPAEKKFNNNGTDRSPRNRTPGHSFRQSTALDSPLNKTSYSPTENKPSNTDNFKRKPFENAKNQNSAKQFIPTQALRSEKKACNGSSQANAVSSDAGQVQEMSGNSVSSTGMKSKLADVKSSSGAQSRACAEIGVEKLPENTFVKVIVTVPLQPRQCWVQLVESASKSEDIIAKLNLTTLTPLQELALGSVCAAQFEGAFFRGRVIQVQPQVKVHFIDFGNEEVYKADQLMSVPESVSNVPALAIKVQLAKPKFEKYSTLEEGQLLSLKTLSVSGDVTVVEVEDEEYERLPAKAAPSQPVPVLTPKPGLPQKVSLVSTLKEGSNGVFMLCKPYSDTKFGVNMLSAEMKQVFADLFKVLNDIKEPPSASIVPSFGDMVLVFCDTPNDQGNKAWMRARVLSIKENNIDVHLVDFACSTTVKNVYRLPPEMVATPDFGAVCDIVKCTNPNPIEYKSLKFKVTSVDKSNGSVTCTISSGKGQDVGEAILKEWNETLIEKRTRGAKECVSLKNEDRVILSHFHHQKLIYVRPASEEKKAALSRIQKDLELHCQKAAELSKIPAVYDEVACRFMDGKFYRAFVTSVQNSKINVFYTDFGNRDVVEKSKLKPLPPELISIPGMAVPVGLKNTEEKPITDAEIGKLMTRLFNEETELKLVFTGTLKDGVELVLPDGRSLNDILNGSNDVKRSKDSHPPQQTVVTEKDIRHSSDAAVHLEKSSDVEVNYYIEYAKLPVGETIDFIILHKGNYGEYAGCQIDEVTKYVHGTMSLELQEYCESAAEEDFLPKYSEMCLAKFEDGLWYRALCAADDNSKEGKTVLFLDYGNTAYVKKSNFRRMTSKYLKSPGVAIACELKDKDKFSGEQLKRIDELVQAEKAYKIHVVSFTDDVGVIEFPHVIKELKL